MAGSEIPGGQGRNLLVKFLQFHGAISLELTAGHSQKCPNIVSVQIPRGNLPVCPSIPEEFSTLSEEKRSHGSLSVDRFM